MKLPLVLILLVVLLRPSFGQLETLDIKRSDGTVSTTDGVDRYLSTEYQFILTLPYGVAMDSLNSFVKDGTELLYYRGWCHYAQGRIPESFADADRYSRVPARQNVYGGYVLLARLHEARFTPMLAEQMLDKAIAIEPKRIDGYLEKARVYANRSDLDGALASIKDVIKRFPSAAEPYLFKGIILTRQQQYKNGYADIQRALTEGNLGNRDFWVANYWAGKACIGTRNYTAALSHANQCIEARPELLEAYGLRGEVYYNMDKLDEALADFVNMERRVQSSYYWKIIASCYERKGDVPSACRYYAKLCQMFPQQDNHCSKLKKLCK